MDRVKLQSRLQECLKQYRYVVIVVLAGVVLMCLPSGKDRTDTERETGAGQTVIVETCLEESLAIILSQIKGAGKVEVLLTEAKGAERTQNGLVRQINPPSYQGAIVVCQGADSPSVRLAIVQAVSSVTGLGTDHITVLKMK